MARPNILYTCGKRIQDDDWKYVGALDPAHDQATPVKGMWEFAVGGLYCSRAGGQVYRMCTRCMKRNGLIW